MIFCARATRGLRRVGRGAARPSFLLAEAARSECAPSMRAVNDSLAAPPRAKWEKRKALAWANGMSMGEEAVLADSGWVGEIAARDGRVRKLRAGEDQKDARGQATTLLARRAPTIQRWSLNARSEGWFAHPLWRR